MTARTITWRGSLQGFPVEVLWLEGRFVGSGPAMEALARWCDGRTRSVHPPCLPSADLLGWGSHHMLAMEAVHGVLDVGYTHEMNFEPEADPFPEVSTDENGTTWLHRY
ncbi:hypothetical protein DYH09_34045 [bacterium CPR1]|nr:hypothetical protein [bacterium CPR1]